MHDQHDHHHHHHGHEHTHHDHHHSHSHADAHTERMISLEQDILQENALFAARNRGYFEAKHILACNLVSSPGSGKTTILEKTLEDMQENQAFFVIEGDQQSARDAERIAATNVRVVQINTGKGCHLDAQMVHKAIKNLAPSEQSMVMIENVGNLVCPALFDLGENYRVVIASVTEGDDKPLKYPEMFHTSQLCLINKTDLLPYVSFDVEAFKQYAHRVNPQLQFIETSATKGTGMQDWYTWLNQKRASQPVPI